jgi:hypothetical protein
MIPSLAARPSISLVDGGLRLHAYETKYDTPFEVDDFYGSLALSKLQFQVREGPVLLATPANAAPAAAESGDWCCADHSTTVVPLPTAASVPAGLLSFHVLAWWRLDARIDEAPAGRASGNLSPCFECAYNSGARKTLSLEDAAGNERYTMQRTNVPCWYAVPYLKDLLQEVFEIVGKILDECLCGFTCGFFEHGAKGCFKCLMMGINIGPILERNAQLKAGKNLVTINLPLFGRLPKMGAPREVQGVIKVRAAVRGGDVVLPLGGVTPACVSSLPFWSR